MILRQRVQQILLLIVLSFPIVANGQGAPLAYGVTWSPDGNWVGVSSNHGAWFYQADNLHAEPTRYLQQSQVSVIAYDGTGKLALMPGDDKGRDDFVSIVNLEEDEVEMAYYAPPPANDGFSVYYDMQFTADNEQLVVANASSIQVFDMASEIAIFSHEFTSDSTISRTSWVTSVALTTDPHRFVTTNGKSKLHVFDATADSITPFDLSDELWLYEAKHWRDTTYLLLADEGIFQFDIDSGDLSMIKQPIEERVTGYALSADKRFLATGSAHQWVLYDLEANEVILNQADVTYDEEGGSLSRYIFSLAFNPDASQLATLQVDGTITIWDTASGDPVATINDFNRAISYRWG